MQYRRKGDEIVKRISSKFSRHADGVVEEALEFYEKVLTKEKEGYRVRAVMDKGFVFKEVKI